MKKETMYQENRQEFEKYYHRIGEISPILWYYYYILICLLSTYDRYNFILPNNKTIIIAPNLKAIGWYTVLTCQYSCLFSLTAIDFILSK